MPLLLTIQFLSMVTEQWHGLQARRKPAQEHSGHMLRCCHTLDNHA